MFSRCLALALPLALLSLSAESAPPPEPGLLFHLSGDHGTVADFSAGQTPKPTYEFGIMPIADGARGGALQCANDQLLAYRAPGNVYAQRGTVSFFWRSRYPVGPTAFPIFRVSYADHSSWDMVFLRIDYNGRGFDAFVTDASLARTRVSVPLQPFPSPETWTHLALAWDENLGVRFYINGVLAARVDTTARYDLALDQFGPHSRIISPYQVQSDYNFVRGGDLDELRIYDRMLEGDSVAVLARAEAPTLSPTAPRSLADPAVRAEWALRYGWSHELPPELPAGQSITIRKVEIHDAYDLKRWWWKATDGIRETTWPGVYNRSRLPGRNDYFQLPDWDCYVESGKAIAFALPAEPWNHLEISGAAWGKMVLLPPGTALAHASAAAAESVLFERPRGRERTIHALPRDLTGRQIRFTNVEQEEPIGELGAYHVSAGTEPAGSTVLRYRLHASEADAPELASLVAFIQGRFPSDERSIVVATTAAVSAPQTNPPSHATLPLVHLLVPNTWDAVTDGLDGIALDLPALGAPDSRKLVSFNLRVKDPLWPLRDMADFTCSVPSDQPRTLWLDLRDRLLPPGKPLWLTVAFDSADVSATTLQGAALRLVFKPRAAARAEHELDRFTQVRDAYAMLVEEHPRDVRLDLWNRFKGDLDDLLRVNPDHVLGRQYAAAGVPGTPRPVFVQPQPPAGIPLWAFRQTELLGRVQRFVEWYVDHRQVAYGDFGGGISDDTDLLNLWPGVALMGCVPDKIQASTSALLDATYRNGMVTDGLPTIQADELHSYEEGINCLGQNLLLAFGSPRQLERAMDTARSLERITGVNAAGHRHIRTSYYSGTTMALEDPWAYAKGFSYLVLQVPDQLVDYNGSPAVKRYLLELADGLLAHHPAEPSSSGPMVPAIRFADDREEEVGRGYFPSHVFWGAYTFTGDRRYLAPLLAHPVTSMVVLNANLVDLLDLRDTWGSRLHAGERAKQVEGRRDASRAPARTSDYRASNAGHFAWQLTGDKTHLEKLYADQIATCALLEYINTEGSLWTDRVGVPTADLQRARLGGVALVRNGVFPGHVLSWRFAAPATAQSVAILVPRATRTEVDVIAYNLETSAVHATLTGWNIDPGLWEIAQAVDANNDEQPDAEPVPRTERFERSRSIEVTLAPRTTTFLTLKRKTPGTPYWERPDLGIDPQDVRVDGDRLYMRVHSLGSVASPASTLTVRDSSGAIIGTARVPALEAPNDLRPKTTEISVAWPVGTAVSGVSVKLDADQQLEEITELNNRVQL